MQVEFANVLSVNIENRDRTCGPSDDFKDGDLRASADFAEVELGAHLARAYNSYNARHDKDPKIKI